MDREEMINRGIPRESQGRIRGGFSSAIFFPFRFRGRRTLGRPGVFARGGRGSVERGRNDKRPACLLRPLRYATFLSAVRKQWTRVSVALFIKNPHLRRPD